MTWGISFDEIPVFPGLLHNRLWHPLNRNYALKQPGPECVKGKGKLEIIREKWEKSDPFFSVHGFSSRSET